MGYEIGTATVWAEPQPGPVFFNKFPSGAISIFIIVADSLGAPRVLF
jgi:hypothetical protein